MTPEAVFEIIGAGSEIPSGFVQPGSGALILEGPWVGVAICATVSVHHVDGYMESKYIVTAHVHLGEKHWKIPVPIHFLVAESETQLVFYWTVADDLQRIVGSSQKSNFDVSFSVDPEDKILQVTKYGIRFIHKEYILHLKQREDSMIKVGRGMYFFSNMRPEIYECDLEACNGYTYMDHHIRKIVDLIYDNGRQQCSLDGIYQIIKGLLEIKKQDLTGWRALLFYRHHVRYYIDTSLEASVIYDDFIQSVKDINDGWLSVKLALEQIVVKGRADNHSYREILQQLDDLEAAKSVGFSDKFIKMIESIFIRTFDIVYNLRLDMRVQSMFSPRELSVEPKEKALAKLLIIITGVLCTVAAYMGDSELLEAMKQTNLSSLFLHLIRAFTDKKHMEGVRFIMKTNCNCELKISDFCDNVNLLQELMNKMGRSSYFTKENEDEMVSVIDRLQNNIQKVSNIIQEMSSHADQHTHHLRK
ncbi:hypothetical protein M8C21_016620, partial [Ambrosia artemisiifolia]